MTMAAPIRRIIRDENGQPIRGKGDRRSGRRGGRGGRGGRAGGGRGSPTKKPQVGDRVSVVEKRHYGTDIRVVGTVGRILTRAAHHPRGFKVMLTTGVVGRCTEVQESRGQEVRASGADVQRQPSDEDSSDAYLAAMEPPPLPGVRLADRIKRSAQQ